jgi:hypothetical protein
VEATISDAQRWSRISLLALLICSDRKRIEGVDKDYLMLKRASASRPSGQWNDDDFDVLANGIVVGWSLPVLRLGPGNSIVSCPENETRCLKIASRTVFELCYISNRDSWGWMLQKRPSA